STERARDARGAAMIAYAARRLAAAIPLLAAISILLFLLLHACPGEPLPSPGPNLRPEDVDRLRRPMHLDRPLVGQYWLWMRDVLRGDWGTSFVTREPVRTMIAARLPATFELMGTALVLAILGGGGAGIVAAAQRGSWFDRAVQWAALVGTS